MPFKFTWLKYAFFAAFLIGAAWSAYHSFWVVKPRQDCERGGGWWDGEERICATPIDISRITGRPNRPRTAAPPAPAPAGAE